MWSVQWKPGEQREAGSVSEVHELIALAKSEATKHPRFFEIVELASGDSLAFVVGGVASVVIIIQNGNTMTSLGSDQSDEVVVYDYIGEWTEIPRRYSVSNELALEVVEEFLVGHKQSTRVSWVQE